MADLPVPVSLRAGGTSRDYSTIFNDMLRLVPQFTKEWTYRGDDDLGVVLLQLTAYLGDHLHYRADTTLRDLRAARTIYRELVKEYGEWLGYLARRPSAAQVGVVFSVPTALGADLYINKGTQVAADLDDTVYFETVDNVVLPAGELSVEATVAEGRTILTPLALGVAAGVAFERFIIPYSDVVFNWGDYDIEVRVDGDLAAHTRWPIEAEPTELSYWVREQRDRTLQLRFGDGNYGALLRPGAVVTANFRRGGGIKGRVKAGGISRVVGSFSLNNNPVDLRVTNPVRTLGGLPEETIDEIRQQGPSFFRSQNRAVTVGDYENAVRSVPGVFQVKAVHAGIDGVILYIVPDGAEDGDVLTNELRSLIMSALDEKKMATDYVTVIQADLVPVDVELNVFAYSTFRNSVVRESVRSEFLAAKGILQFQSNFLGKTLRQSDMINRVEDIDGVDYVDVLRYTRRPVLRWLDRTGDAELSEAGVTVSMFAQEQTWTIQFLTETEYSVRGSVSGLQVNQGELDMVYADDNGEVSFLIVAGDELMGEGDRGEIIVGRLAWNIRLFPREFPVAGKVTITTTGGIN